jgi:hypothetical protein
MNGPAIGRDHFGVASGASRLEVTHYGGSSGPAPKRATAQYGIASCQQGIQLTRSLISAFMMGNGQFCAVIAGHSPPKHLRPLSGPRLDPH